jgi:hypothetical protein
MFRAQPKTGKQQSRKPAQKGNFFNHFSRKKYFHLEPNTLGQRLP